MRELLSRRIAEDAKKTPPAPAPRPATEKTEETTAPTPLAPKKKETAKQSAAKKRDTPPEAMLPKVEVKKSRITELDQKLAQQEEAIAREKKNLKSSELDNALNDAKIARPLAIFGGDSTQFRKHVANERVELMEAEKDLIEAIAHAKTKEEKAELQKQLDQLKAMRRDLDKALR